MLKLGPVYAALPFAVISLLASALAANPRHGLPTAAGLAIIFTIGFQAARLLVAQSDALKLMLAFVVGTVVLAVSVAIDFALGANRLPSGLFHDQRLHNWAGALFALAFPFALYLIGRDRSHRIVGLLSAAAIAAATLLSLSWVGMIGVAIGALVYGVLAGGAIVRLLFVTTIIVISFFPVWKSSVDGLIGHVRLRGYSLETIESIVRERAAIHRAGVGLAMARPALGWGHTGRSVSLKDIPGLRFAQLSRSAELGPTANLLLASEAFSASPWQQLHAEVDDNIAIAPDGSHSADLLSGTGVPGERVFQFVPTLNATDNVFTFTVWVRAHDDHQWLGLAIRDARGGTRGLQRVDVPFDQVAEVQGVHAVRFLVDRKWKRIGVTATFDDWPVDGIIVSLYLDGYYAQLDADGRFYAWGAQLNHGPAGLPYEPTTPALLGQDVGALSHFHNWFIQTLFESGLLGLLSLLGLLIYVFWTATRHSASSSPAIGAISGFLATQYFDLAVEQVSILFSFILAMAFAMQPVHLHHSRPKDW